MVRIKGVTRSEQVWIGLNNFFTFGLYPFPIQNMLHHDSNKRVIPLPECFSVDKGVGTDSETIRMCYTEVGLTDNELPIKVNVLALMKHIHLISGGTEEERGKRVLGEVGKQMEDILKAWDAPYKWLKWLNLNNCDETTKNDFIT